MLPFYPKAAFELPDGPKNLATLFSTVDFSQVDQYYVVLKTTGDAVLVTTPINQMGKCCTPDTVRIIFENALGKWDAASFEQVQVEQETTSQQFQRILPTPFVKTDTGSERFNVREGLTYTATTYCYDETAMPWLKELARATKAFLQWTGTEGQADDYLPIVVLDGKQVVLKQDERFVYYYVISFKLANEAIIQRI